MPIDMLGLHGATTFEEWEGLAQEQLIRLGMTSPRKGGTVKAYVNRGRWVADCPHCNGGIGVSPRYKEAMDFSCGTRYTVEFPSDWPEASTVLDARPPDNANWKPNDQRVMDLKEENLRRGVPMAGPPGILHRPPGPELG
jgi:hypothetical protein